MKNPPLHIPLLIALALPGHGAGLSVPTVSLPASSGPVLWSGFSASETAALQARASDPAYAAYVNSVKTFVDGNISNIATLGDNDRARLAKGAAFLERMGYTPPAGSPGGYAAAAVNAINAMAGRNPWVLLPPANQIDHLVDSGSLQSMAEAYDMLRGVSSITSAQRSAMEAKIWDWSDAVKRDIYMTTLNQRFSNWAVKSGSALVTAALAIRENADAAGFLSTGVLYLNQGLSSTIDETGFNRESAWYTNYGLNNLYSTAQHVQNATGVSWWAALKPIAEFASTATLPDGTLEAFEEGLPTNLPYDVMWSKYSDLGGGIKWIAGNQTRAVSSNFENQQLAALNRFFMVDQGVAATTPTGPATAFLSSADVSFNHLASGHDSSATVAQLLAAKDLGSADTPDSRHYSRNFGDMSVFLAGANRVVTSGGGNMVTNTAAADRSNFINNVQWKNIPTVDGASPYITSGSQIAQGDRLDGGSAPDGSGANLMDSAKVSASTFSGGTQVERGAHLIGNDYVAVSDHFRDDTSHTDAISWHIRGARSDLGLSGTATGYRYTLAGADVELWMAGSSSATISNVNSLYPQTFGGSNEIILGVNLAVTGANESILSVIIPDSTSVVTGTAISSGRGAAMSVSRNGVTDHLLASANGAVGSDGYILNGDFAVVRKNSADQVLSFAMRDATSLSAAGVLLASGSSPLTASFSYLADGFEADISGDTPAFSELYVHFPGASAGNWSVRWNDAMVAAADYQVTSDGLLFSTLSGGGNLRANMIPEPSGTALPGAGVVLMLLRRKRNR